MPIKHHIDNDQRLVIAMLHGVLTEEELLSYQREVWSLPEVAGYDELIDMSEIERIVSPSSDRVRHLANLAASMDEKTAATKIAIVAPNDFTYGLARMYETFRNLDKRSKKEVGVFRSSQDAAAWLGKKL